MLDRVQNFEILVDNPALNRILGRGIQGWDVFDRKIEAAHTLDNISPGDYIEFVNKVGSTLSLQFLETPYSGGLHDIFKHVSNSDVFTTFVKSHSLLRFSRK